MLWDSIILWLYEDIILMSRGRLIYYRYVIDMGNYSYHGILHQVLFHSVGVEGDIWWIYR